MKIRQFLTKSSRFFLASLIIFIIFFIVGVFFPIFFREEIINFIKSLGERISGMNAFQLIFFIFRNNLQASFFALVLGIFVCVFPIFMLIANGYLVGFVLHFAIVSEGPLVFWKLFPHGIFEIPAILISAGLGIKLGFDLLHNYIKKNENNNSYIFLTIIFGIISPFLLFLFLLFSSWSDNSLKTNLKNNFLSSIKIFLYIVFPLLVIAAVIEGLLIYILG